LRERGVRGHIALRVVEPSSVVLFVICDLSKFAMAAILFGAKEWPVVVVVVVVVVVYGSVVTIQPDLSVGIGVMLLDFGEDFYIKFMKSLVDCRSVG